MDISPLYHTLMALVPQLIIGLVTGNWWYGVAIGSAWFISRELTQAEFRWIEKFGDGERKNLPWWGCFDVRIWDIGSVLDWLCPVVGVLIVAMVVSYL